MWQLIVLSILIVISGIGFALSSSHVINIEKLSNQIFWGICFIFSTIAGATLLILQYIERIMGK